MIEQELGNLLPFEVPFATVLTMVEVDPADPAFTKPDKPIGPVYGEEEARRLAAERGWAMAPTETGSAGSFLPPPEADLRDTPIKWLLEKGTIVICAGGADPDHVRGGAQAARRGGGDRQGPGQRPASRELEADFFIMATDVSAVQVGWGTPDARAIRRASPAPWAGSIRGRLHGAEGGSSPGVRREDGEDRRNRGPGRHRGDPRGRAGTLVSREVPEIEWA